MVNPSCEKIGAVAPSTKCWWGSEQITIPSSIENSDADVCCNELCPSGWCSDQSGCAETTYQYAYIASTTVAGGYCYQTATCDSCTDNGKGEPECTYDITTCTVPTYCGQGYYKSGNTCIECPELSTGATTATGYSTAGITRCYMPLGTTGSDTEGKFVYDGNSYWCD